MNVSSVQNNNSQSFGMALKLKGNGAKKLAESFHDAKAPKTAEKIFMEEIAEPIQRLKSEVIYDGKRVLVKDANNPDNVLEVLSSNRDSFHMDEDFSLLYAHVNKDGAGKKYKIHYDSNFDQVYDELYSHSGNDLKFRIAREIARDMDAKAAQNAYSASRSAEEQASIDETAKKLQDLFG